MNGKQAKRLRKAALGLASVLTESGKDIKKDGYQVKVHENKLSASSTFDPKGVLSSAEVTHPQPKLPSYQLLVRKDSMKGIYKTLKLGKM